MAAREPKTSAPMRHFNGKTIKDIKEAGVRLNTSPFFSRVTSNLRTRMQKKYHRK